MTVRVIYSDLDGTMVGPFGCFFRTGQFETTLEPARALVDLLEAGVALVLVSGRTRAQLTEAARIFGADGYIGELGAVVGWGFPQEHVVLRGAMPDEYDDTLCQLVERTGLTQRLLEHHAGRLELHSPWHEGHEADLMLRGNVNTAATETWLAAQGFGWLRLRDNGVLPVPELGHLKAPVHVYHLMADGLSKGAGVAVDLARRGVSREEAIAIGDSVSDLSIAPYVRRFFLVANGARSAPTLAAAEEHDNVTICAGELGAGWVEAVRWAVQNSQKSHDHREEGMGDG